MGDFKFTEKGFDHYVYWQSQDKKTLKKINELLQDIDRRGPMQGKGHPERLKHRHAYSRTIDEANRLIYEVDGDQITVESCKGHYEDK